MAPLRTYANPRKKVSTQSNKVLKSSVHLRKRLQISSDNSEDRTSEFDRLLKGEFYNVKPKNNDKSVDNSRNLSLSRSSLASIVRDEHTELSENYNSPIVVLRRFERREVGKPDISVKRRRLHLSSDNSEDETSEFDHLQKSQSNNFLQNVDEVTHNTHNLSSSTFSNVAAEDKHTENSFSHSLVVSTETSSPVFQKNAISDKIEVENESEVYSHASIINVQTLNDQLQNDVPKNYLDNSALGRSIRSKNKSLLMTNLGLQYNDSLYTIFENSIKKISTPRSYFLRKKQRNEDLKLNDTTDPLSSLEATNSNNCRPEKINDTLSDKNLLEPTTTSTPVPLRHKSKGLQNESNEADKFSETSGSTTPECGEEFENAYEKKRKIHENVFQRKKTSQLPKGTRVILKRMPQLENIIQSNLTNSTDVQLRFLSVRNSAYVTKRRPIKKSFHLFSPKAKQNDPISPREKRNSEHSKENESPKHKCSEDCEHFTKTPIVLLERFDFGKINDEATKKSPVPTNQSSLNDTFDSIDEFHGFSIKSASNKSENASIQQKQADNITLKTDSDLLTKDNFQPKKCFVVLERMKFNDETRDENKVMFDSVENKNKKKTSDCWVILGDDSTESGLTTKENKAHPIFQKRDFVSLQPGKKFRRSMSVFKNKTFGEHMNISGKLDCLNRKTLHRSSFKLVPVPPLTKENELTELGNFVLNNSGYVSIRQSARRSSLEHIHNYLDVQPVNDYQICHTKNCSDQLTARDIILKRCGQTAPLNFAECYPVSALQHCQKIGEGVFGEVFMMRDKDGSITVMKVIPIEGEQIVNLEKQKTFGEILSEVIISMELSNLRSVKRNNTDAFVEVKAIRCVEGCYPNRLLELWELYDENKQSENDSPSMFNSDQLYMVLELANAGKDLEAYQFTNAQQGLAVIEQVTCALAVAESELQFEHRDLHWGNVLITPTEQTHSTYIIDGKEININNRGVKATVIDFTLSRVQYEGVIIFNDLSMDQDLFTAKGDYQFDIYRRMQEHNGNIWQPFKPYTNILWLHYLLKKAIESNGFRYKYDKSKQHKNAMKILTAYEGQILDCNTTSEFIEKNFSNELVIH